mmetsp:Transcript_15981/g.39987  ORF Transcript_15981/g.39987 Transcript_15981/m.39987 type:complete len:314 (-) Transcript_15981:577-1518(-)
MVQNAVDGVTDALPRCVPQLREALVAPELQGLGEGPLVEDAPAGNDCVQHQHQLVCIVRPVAARPARPVLVLHPGRGAELARVRVVPRGLGLVHELRRETDSITERCPPDDATNAVNERALLQSCLAGKIHCARTEVLWARGLQQGRLLFFRHCDYNGDHHVRHLPSSGHRSWKGRRIQHLPILAVDGETDTAAESWVLRDGQHRLKALNNRLQARAQVAQVRAPQEGICCGVPQSHHSRVDEIHLQAAIVLMPPYEGIKGFGIHKLPHIGLLKAAICHKFDPRNGFQRNGKRFSDYCSDAARVNARDVHAGS